LGGLLLLLASGFLVARYRPFGYTPPGSTPPVDAAGDASLSLHSIKPGPKHDAERNGSGSPLFTPSAESASGPPPTARLRIGAQQSDGAREEQQDAYVHSNPDDREARRRTGMLLLVADGMGGLPRGREASQTAVRTFQSEYERRAADRDVPAALSEALEAAHAAVCDLGRSSASGSGTTLVAAAIVRDCLHWISTGDSCLYLLRADELVRLNVDHTVRREQRLAVARGHADPSSIRAGANAVSSYVGFSHGLASDRTVRPFPLRDGDRILLCSDGTYESDIRALSGSGEPQEAADAIVQAAMNRGNPSQDNVTVVIAEYRLQDTPHPSSLTRMPA
jgi:protein phosphatase